MKFLLFSLTCFLMGCASQYKALKTVKPDVNCIYKIRPSGISTSWFDTGVDVQSRHFSGLLLIKQMPENKTRIVFTSETGLTIFDFEFGRDDYFQVKQIQEQLNKKIVIETLRMDFWLLLAIPFRDDKNILAWNNGEEIFFGVEHKNETAYFVTDKNCTGLQRMELGAGRKRKFSIVQKGGDTHPEEVTITHDLFPMVIRLKKIERDANR
jgi:hypothetical protein